MPNTCSPNTCTPLLTRATKLTFPHCVKSNDNLVTGVGSYYIFDHRQSHLTGRECVSTAHRQFITTNGIAMHRRISIWYEEARE